jgi:hypothetical protein
VAVVSANDVWAVGSYADNSAYQRTLVERWNGSAWNVVPSPNAGMYDNLLFGVAAISSSDVWAVGSYHVQTLVEHWDGNTWNVVPSPNPGANDNTLLGVAAISSSDVWAAGRYNNGSVSQTLVEHWNGSAWNIVPSPNVGASYNFFNGVAAVSSSDVWAVGGYRNGSTLDQTQTLVEHWDGNTWNVVPSPNATTLYNGLTAVAAVSSSDVWVVGFYDTGSVLKTLVERYNPCAPAPTPTPQPPPCPGERFTDVCPTDYFYTSTLALADDSVLSGYNTSPPCRNDLWIPCFNPYSSSTRGQISKVVSLAAGFNEPVSGQMFEDVPPGATFYTYTERMAERGIISGYPCGGPREPCLPPDNRPYFRTNNNVTRGQLSKMVSLAFGWSDPPVGQDFEDVPPGSTFYTYVAQLHSRNIIQGYPCGGAGEPCVPPDNLPYFRPNSNVLRGQTAKIVQLARTQRTATPTATLAPMSTATFTPTATSVLTPPATVTATATAVTTTPEPTTTVARR